MKTAIIYTRISGGPSQKRTGYSLAKQLSICEEFCITNEMEVIGVFQDVKSGKDDENRVGLQNALQSSKDTGASIIVSDLSRLGRDVHFISGLMKHGVPFIVAPYGKDVPSFLLHVFASFAEMERKLISTRTKEALLQAKKRGVKLGTHNPDTYKRLMKARKTTGDKTFKRIWPHIADARKAGCHKLREIKEYLDAKEVLSARGKPLQLKTISLYCKRADTMTHEEWEALYK